MPASSAPNRNGAAGDAPGSVPLVLAELHEHNPAAARLYRDALTLVDEGTLTEPERALVLLTVSRYNDGPAAASVHAEQAVSAGLDRELVEAVDRGGLPPEGRLRVLVQATRLLLDKYGWLDAADLDSLERNGVDRAALYEINVLIGLASFGTAVAHVAPFEDGPERPRD